MSDISLRSSKFWFDVALNANTDIDSQRKNVKLPVSRTFYRDSSQGFTERPSWQLDGQWKQSFTSLNPV